MWVRFFSVFPDSMFPSPVIGRGCRRRVRVDKSIFNLLLSHRILCALFFLCLLLSACAHSPHPSSETAQDQSVRRHVELGMAYLEQGNRVRAKEKLLYAVSVDPKSSLAQRAMGYYWELVGDIPLAEKAYEQSLKGKHGEAYNDYGAFLCRQQRYIDADRAFEQALKDIRYTRTAATIENRALCAAQAGDLKKADRYFEKAKQYDPSL